MIIKYLKIENVRVTHNMRFSSHVSTFLLYFYLYFYIFIEFNIEIKSKSKFPWKIIEPHKINIEMSLKIIDTFNLRFENNKIFIYQLKFIILTIVL